MEEGSKAIRVVGPRRVQNELLAARLQADTGIPCTAGDGLVEAVAVSPCDGTPVTLVLRDFSGIALDELLRRLKIAARAAQGPNLLALFNVPQGAGIESEALRVGVRGFFYEADGWNSFVRGVAAVFAGELWASRRLLTECLLQGWVGGDGVGPTPELTPREAEVLALVALGASNDSVAERLCISVHTAKTHVYRIFQKIGVSNRLEAALWAAKYL